VSVAYLSTTNSLLNSRYLKIQDGFSFQRDAVPVPVPYQSDQISPPPPIPMQATAAPSPSSKISPAVLFIIVILAVIFFISGLLHLLVRFIIRKQPESSSSISNQNQQTEISGSEALQRQLQQLFHLHDSGLDQAFIDALPVFLYKEIVGAKEPFDCAVCLCEFSEEDKLRLLPLCGHAFHLNCIDTWLLSNSTCPLCRGALFVPGLTIENPVFEFDELMEEGRLSCSRDNGFSISGRKSSEVEAARMGEKLVLPVRLGKFKNVNKRDSGGGQDTDGNSNPNGVVKREEGESSSSSLDARRCYSMGSYQYVLGDVNLKVSLCTESKRFGDAGTRVGSRSKDINANSITNEVMDGKRISASSKGESFSVSKIWQWPNNKGKMPVISTEISSMDSSSLAWPKRSLGGT
jgi:Ring finger domain